MSIEEHEEIPWSMLVDQDRRGRSRTWYGAAALILAMVVGLTGIRWVNGHRSGETPEETAAANATATTAAAAVPTTEAMLSEADLMALDPLAVSIAAVTRAEWFVTDYFTVDGAPAPDLAAAFAADAVIPDLPHDTVDGPVSFVEWARATALRPHATGVMVTVLFRTLYANAEGRFLRSPVRAVDVLVLVEDGATAIGDLPIPVDQATAHGIDGWMPGTHDGPGEVRTIEDPSGLLFPMAGGSGTWP